MSQIETWRFNQALEIPSAEKTGQEIGVPDRDFLPVPLFPVWLLCAVAIAGSADVVFGQ